jgi:hypothetical protein
MLKIGQRVKYRGTGKDEVGVVVWTWPDADGDMDTYVAFFGASYPDGEPARSPYILRYYETSLEVIDPILS